MFSTDKVMLRGAIALAAFAGLGSAALAETFVVRSLGPSARAYPAGKALASNARVTLKAGDSLTVLDAKGTRTLRGPGNFSLAASSAARTNTSFTSLVSTQSRRRARTGASRNDGKPAHAPSLWFVDVSKSATMCLAPGAPVTLWRADMTRPLALTLRNEATGQSAPVSFAAGSNDARWPTAMPTAEGARYSLTAPGQAPTTVRFTGLSANLADAGATAAALNAKGCRAQYDVLVATMETDAAPAS